MKSQLHLLFEEGDSDAVIHFDKVENGYKLVSGTRWSNPAWIDKHIGDVFSISMLKSLPDIYTGNLCQCSCGGPHIRQHCHSCHKYQRHQSLCYYV